MWVTIKFLANRLSQRSYYHCHSISVASRLYRWEILENSDKAKVYYIVGVNLYICLCPFFPLLILNEHYDFTKI